MYEKLASEFNITQKQAKAIVCRALDLVVEKAASEGKVYCSREHYFKRVDKQARNYRNPRTGEAGVTTPSSYVMYRKVVGGPVAEVTAEAEATAAEAEAPAAEAEAPAAEAEAPAAEAEAPAEV